MNTSPNHAPAPASEPPAPGMHAGFVGTGNMGRPMAANLLRAGHRLTVYDKRLDATAELERQGASRAGSLADLARESRVTFLSLPDESVVAAVVAGEGDSLLAGARTGDVVIDLSTVSPESTRRLAARAADRGVRLVDAPVSGSVSGAGAGTLAIMIGAPPADVTPWAPLLRAMGRTLFPLGALGLGNTLKLLNNYVALGNQAVLCEAVALSDRLGVSRETVREVLAQSSGASFMLERKGAAIVRHAYEAGFFVDLGRKDLGLALDLAGEVGARVTLGREVWRLYDEASQRGLGGLDTSGLLRLLEP